MGNTTTVTTRQPEEIPIEDRKGCLSSCDLKGIVSLLKAKTTDENETKSHPSNRSSVVTTASTNGLKSTNRSSVVTAASTKGLKSNCQ